MEVYVAIDSQVGEVLGVCMSEELALRTIVLSAIRQNLDLSGTKEEKNKYDPSCTYITIEGYEYMIVERELVEEE